MNHNVMSESTHPFTHTINMTIKTCIENAHNSM